VNLGTNFIGLNINDTPGYEPPDTIAAAGPNHVVELVNTDMRIFNKTGGVISTQDLGTFFASLHPQSLSDPAVMFDETISNGAGNPAGRFIVSILDFNTSSSAFKSSFDVAISNDADPTHGFTEMHQIDMTEGAKLFADYPRVGWNADGYFFSFNMFDQSLTTFQHVQVLTIDKSTVLDANNATFAKYQVDPAGSNFTMAPATMHGSVVGDPMWFVEETNVDSGGDGLGGNTIHVIKWTWTNNVLSNSPMQTDYSISVTPYAAPPNAAQPGGTITTNDTRILNAAWRGDRLVADQTVGVGTVAQARWYEFNTHMGGTPTLTQSGNIAGDPTQGSNVSTYYPAIEIAANGDLGMTFMESSSSQDMSMYVTGQSTGGPAGVMQTPVLVKAGEDTYFGSRAGDFSGITVDPVTGTSFWAASEYTKQGFIFSYWGTWIANFSLTAPDSIPPSVTVTAPNGGESWTAGTTQNITWTATDNLGVTSVDLYYSTTGSGGTFTVIATGLANTGSYAWKVPNTASTNAFVKAVAHDAAGNTGTDLSDAAFTIIGVADTTPPSVTVTAPNGGQSWTAGTTHNITWTATDNVGVTSIDLYYSTTGSSGSFTAIATGIANTGSYAWKVPNISTSNAFVKVVAHDAAGNTGVDLSNSAFRIKSARRSGAISGNIPPGSLNPERTDTTSRPLPPSHLLTSSESSPSHPENSGTPKTARATALVPSDQVDVNALDKVFAEGWPDGLI
jgi:hypothetical protein